MLKEENNSWDLDLRSIEKPYKPGMFFSVEKNSTHILILIMKCTYIHGFAAFHLIHPSSIKIFSQKHKTPPYCIKTITSYIISYYFIDQSLSNLIQKISKTKIITILQKLLHPIAYQIVSYMNISSKWNWNPLKSTLKLYQELE